MMSNQHCSGCPSPSLSLPPHPSLLRTRLLRSSGDERHPRRSPIFRIDSLQSLQKVPIFSLHSASSTASFSDGMSLSGSGRRRAAAFFPSMRLLLAVLLCCCYITISISSSNISVALVCMIRCPSHGYTGELEWESNEEGLVLAAQNAGLLLCLLTGLYADRINAKWMIGAALFLCLVGNTLLPWASPSSFWFAVGARLLVGGAEAMMTPSVNSLITRWFPQEERAAAVGLVSCGRQLGTLFILPTAGFLCTRVDIQGGWPAIFYLSTLISGLVFLFWMPMGADKPSKQCCISRSERLFIEGRIACESIGKRTDCNRCMPWRQLLRSRPLWAGIFSLICHEYPLVIMLQFLPNYLRDVLEFAPAKNGIVSAIPILFLLLSKALSSALCSWLNVHTSNNRSTNICKLFNGVASLGLALSIAAVPQFGKEEAHMAIIALCSAMTFAGLHTPGVQTALLHLAPPFSGVITGLACFCVSWFSILNKLLTKWLVRDGEREEWAQAFYISAVVAALPLVVFTLWGSNRAQWWAAPHTSRSSSTNTSISFRRLSRGLILK